MKVFAVLSVIASLAIAAPAVAAPVTMTFQNVSTTTPMTVSKINTCGVLLPAPVTVNAGNISAASSTDCGNLVSASHVTYAMGAKACIFHISTIYTPPNPLLGTSGYWTPSASTTPSGGATCKVVSQDISNIFTTGAFKAVFSMK
jgi:hypothetical protein